jgi:hypothetical protein
MEIGPGGDLGWIVRPARALIVPDGWAVRGCHSIGIIRRHVSRFSLFNNPSTRILTESEETTKVKATSPKSSVQ